MGKTVRKLSWVDRKCVKSEERICFGIKWFATEADAMRFDKAVKAENLTYNGGWFHGMRCGRDASFDMVEDGRKLYAVTN